MFIVKLKRAQPLPGFWSVQRRWVWRVPSHYFPDPGSPEASGTMLISTEIGVMLWVNKDAKTLYDLEPLPHPPLALGSRLIADWDPTGVAPSPSVGVPTEVAPPSAPDIMDMMRPRGSGGSPELGHRPLIQASHLVLEPGPPKSSHTDRTHSVLTALAPGRGRPPPSSTCGTEDERR